MSTRSQNQKLNNVQYMIIFRRKILWQCMLNTVQCYGYHFKMEMEEQAKSLKWPEARPEWAGQG